MVWAGEGVRAGVVHGCIGVVTVGIARGRDIIGAGSPHRLLMEMSSKWWGILPSRRSGINPLHASQREKTTSTTAPKKKALGKLMGFTSAWRCFGGYGRGVVYG